MTRLLSIFLFSICGLLRAGPLVEHSVRVECKFVFGRGLVSSMGEHLADGDIVRVLPVPMERVREHMTIEVESATGHPAPNYSHEVIAVRHAANGELYFITKGTANMVADWLHVTAAEYRGVLDIPLIQHHPKS